MVSFVAFVLFYLFLVSSLFGASGRLCFMIVAFPGYLHYFVFFCPFCLLFCCFVVDFPFFSDKKKTHKLQSNTPQIRNESQIYK